MSIRYKKVYKFFPFFFLVCCFNLNLTINAQEWTRFRGPNGTGISTAETIPIKFSEKDFNWKITLPGRGHGSPVIWNDILFVTSAEEKTNRGFLLAIDTNSGKIIWEKEFEGAEYNINTNNSYSSSTPAVDEKKVYFLWIGPEKSTLMAFSHKGEKVWQRDFNAVLTRHGFGNSPILVGDLVIFNLEQEEVKNSPDPSKWMGIDRETGDIRWQLHRKTAESNSYASPFIFKGNENRSELIFTSEAHGFTAVNPQNGTVLWSLEDVFDSRSIASPILAGDLIIGTCKSELVAVNPNWNSGTPKVAYKLANKNSPYVPTPLYIDGILFNFVDNGYIAAVEAKTGKVFWREKPAGRYYGSPISVNNTIYCMTREGEVVVLNADKSYQLLAVNDIGEGSHATPAVSNKKMFLRTFSHLISLGGK